MNAPNPNPNPGPAAQPTPAPAPANKKAKKAKKNDLVDEAAIVAAALAGGNKGFDKLQKQHRQQAVNAGATLVTAGLVTTRNAANAPIVLDTTALAAALGVQAAPATDATQANATAANTATANATTQAPATPTTESTYRSPVKAAVWASVAAIIALVAYIIVRESAPEGNDWDWTRNGGVGFAIVVLAALAFGLIAWTKTPYSARPARPARPPRQTVVNVPPSMTQEQYQQAFQQWFAAQQQANQPVQQGQPLPPPAAPQQAPNQQP